MEITSACRPWVDITAAFPAAFSRVREGRGQTTASAIDCQPVNTLKMWQYYVPWSSRYTTYLTRSLLTPIKVPMIPLEFIALKRQRGNTST